MSFRVIGIIIDTFAELRDEKKQNDSLVMNTCFICGLNKSQFDSRSSGWSAHVFQDHNAYAYMFYVFYLQEKKMSHCDGLEKFVKEKMRASNVDFFPLNKALELPESLKDPQSDMANPNP